MTPFPPWFAAHMDGIALGVFGMVWSALVFWWGWSEGASCTGRRIHDHWARRYLDLCQLIGAEPSLPPRDPKTGRFTGRKG